MAIHERPKVLLFVPYATTARICGTRYINALAITNVGFLIADLNGVLQQQGTSVGTGPNFNVTGLTLTVGTTYTARIQYTNASGTSVWSKTLAATVFSSGFDLTPLAGPTLPGDLGAPFTLALAPSYRVEIQNLRGLVTHTSQAGHHIRRLTASAGTVRVRLQWVGLTLAQRNTVLAALQDSLGSYESADVRGFSFSTVQSAEPRIVSGTVFLPILGTIIHRELIKGVYEVVIDANEISP